MRGRVRVHPQALVGEAFALDQPAAINGGPSRRARASKSRCAIPRWRGAATDISIRTRGPNRSKPGSRDWDWSRAHRARDTAILYDGARRDGSTFGLALRIDAAGPGYARRAAARRTTAAHAVAHGASDARGRRHGAGVARTFEDSPFYARAAIATRLFGEQAIAVHETLSLDRFARPWVKWMLPFRMPRALR